MNTVYVLIVIAAVLLVWSIVLFVSLKKSQKQAVANMDKYVNLLNAIHIASDEIPSMDNSRARALKLSNEIDKYVKVDNDAKTLTLLVVEPSWIDALK